MNLLTVGTIIALLGLWLMWGRKDIFALFGLILCIVGLGIIIRAHKKIKN